VTTILYARVSTKEQTIEHQLTQAENAGFMIDEVIADDGVSGVSTTLAERPQGRRLFDMLRSGDTLVVRWVDRLGRDYADVSDSIRVFMRKGVVVKTVISGMVFDGSTKEPMQQAVRDALIGFMAALSQAQAEATKEAQRAGIEHARSHVEKYLGRKPVFDRAQFEEAQAQLALDVPVAKIAKKLNISRQTVMRMRDDPDKAAEILKTWGL
jgi:DNA invertase Pin-like site-specific DNA recombinase